MTHQARVRISGVERTPGMRGRLLLIDALDTDFQTVNLQRNPLCPVCGHLSVN